MERDLVLSGNEAIARGAQRAGVAFVCGRRGIPSTEIIETAAALDGVRVQWSANEKVALETAAGASLAGVRSLVIMGHAGLDAAADPFMALSLTGVGAGLVVVCTDDPGMRSSRSRQDSRAFARFARVPMLEPADSQEAYDFVAEAFALSEEFAVPVLLRTTVGLSCGSGRVLPRVPVAVPPRASGPDVVGRYATCAEYARRRCRLTLDRLQRLRARSEESPLNVLEAGTVDFGIISAGPAFQYARDAFPKAWFLKLGLSHPLPHAKVARLYQSVARIAVVEELDPFIEDQVRALGVPVVGKEVIPADGALDAEAVFAALEPFLRRRPPRRRRPVLPPPPRLSMAPEPPAGLPVRPPVFCPGCSRRSVYEVLRRRTLTSFHDLDCSTRGALPPLLALSSCLCTGAGVGLMAGFNQVLGRKAAAAVIDDSTFFHSGVTALIDAFHNAAEGLVVVLDDRTTEMPASEGQPRTDPRRDCSDGRVIDIRRLCDGIGVRCTTVGSGDEAAVDAAVAAELEAPGLGVIVVLGSCLLALPRGGRRVVVDWELCDLCGLCLDLGCPAIVPGEAAVTLTGACTGCALCVEVCGCEALREVRAGDPHGAAP